MKKQQLYILLLAIVAVVAVLQLVVHREREPSYGGKRLSEWVQVLALEPTGRNESSERDARQALHMMGTNSIPYLLEWIAYQPPHWKFKLYAASNQKIGWPGSGWLDRDSKMVRAAGAVNALGALGLEGKGAVKELTRLLIDPDPGFGAVRAADALANMGTTGLPALLTVLTNGRTRFRWVAASRLGGMGTNGGPAVTGLIRCLGEDDFTVAANAATALGRLKLEPDLVVPALVEALRSTNLLVRQMAGMSLVRFGTNAQPALSALLPLLHDPNISMRRLATNAVRAIDPEALGKKSERWSTAGKGSSDTP